MHAKTMTGLVGATASISLADVSRKIFHEASRKGDTGTMERAAQYAGEFTDKANKYAEKAQEGMAEEARENREETQKELKQQIEKNREERQKTEELLRKYEETEAGTMPAQTTGMSGGSADSSGLSKDGSRTGEGSLTYTKTGEASMTEQEGSVISISV